jgi:hypothetical protein
LTNGRVKSTEVQIMTTLGRMSRATKLEVVRAITGRLQKRIDDGGAPDPGLDSFQVEMNDSIARLSTHVDGVATVKGARAALDAASDESDDVVDCWSRKLYGFFNAEALRRTGPHAGPAKKLFEAAFPDGLDYIDARIALENEQCKKTIQVLRAKENEELLLALEVPAGWIDKFEAAVVKSDADCAAVAQGRSEKSTHVGLGRNAEREWEDLMIRFRHHIASRAKAHEVEKKAEGRELIDPLLAAVKKMRADAEMRATLRAKAKAESESPVNGGAPGAPAGQPVSLPV